MSMFAELDIGASGLRAQRMRLDTIANNVANVNVTRDENGNIGPYQRRFVVMAPGQPEDPSKPGVRVLDIKKSNTGFGTRYDPDHPDAVNGYVKLPNVDLSVEFVNALEATRAYEANITMMETTKSMISSSLRLIA